MADFLFSRAIEDFLINPVMSFDMPSPRTHRFIDRAADIHGLASPTRRLMLKSEERLEAKPSGALLRLIDDEPSYLQGYASEEEAASPLDVDAISVDSAPEETSHDEPMLPELLARSCQGVQHQCRKAQAVTLRTAGKVRVIEVPRLIDCPGPRNVRRNIDPRKHFPSPAEPVSASGDDGSQRSSQDSRADSSDLSGPQSAASTAPSTPQDVQAPKRQRNFTYPPPSVDLIAAVREAKALRAAAETKKRKLARFPPSLKLTRLGKGLVRGTSINANTAFEDEVQAQKPIAATLTPLAKGSHHDAPVRSQSVRTKMVARGANEREPPIVLPPFPIRESQDDMRLRWPPERKSREQWSTHRRSISSAQMISTHG